MDEEQRWANPGWGVWVSASPNKAAGLKNNLKSTIKRHVRSGCVSENLTVIPCI